MGRGTARLGMRVWYGMVWYAGIVCWLWYAGVRCHSGMGHVVWYATLCYAAMLCYATILGRGNHVVGVFGVQLWCDQEGIEVEEKEEGGGGESGRVGVCARVWVGGWV